MFLFSMGVNSDLDAHSCVISGIHFCNHFVYVARIIKYKRYSNFSNASVFSS